MTQSHMSYGLNSLKGFYRDYTGKYYGVGVIKGDTKSLAYSSAGDQEFRFYGA